MNNIVPLNRTQANPDEYFIRLCNSPAQQKRREEKRTANWSALCRRVIWMHTALFLSGLFAGLALGVVIV